MRRNNWFQFKQFRIEQKESAMKVGTDGVILGAWATTDKAERILDIGTGTGLIALMLAQRSDSEIDAVEIDETSCKEAAVNFSNSPWNERLNVYHQDFCLFAKKTDKKYDLIVSNPPFFIDSLHTPDPKSAVARHNVSLNFEQLITGSSKLLIENGRFCVIIPSMVQDSFRETARLTGLYLKKRSDIVSQTGKPAIRVLLEFSPERCYAIKDEITIKDVKGEFTREFRLLTESYYLNF